MNKIKSYTIILQCLVQLNWNSVQSLNPRHKSRSCSQSTECWTLNHNSSKYTYPQACFSSLLELTLFVSCPPYITSGWRKGKHRPTHCWSPRCGNHARVASPTIAGPTVGKYFWRGYQSRSLCDWRSVGQYVLVSSLIWGSWSDVC
jgi:hypothetical protein